MLRVGLVLLIMLLFWSPADAAQGATGNGTSPIICDATVAKCANVVTMPNGLNAPVVAGFVDSITSVQSVACDKSASINITTTSTTEIVLVSGATAIYVCGFLLDKSSGAGTTMQFLYGTKTTTGCDTGPVVLTGPMDGNQAILAIGSGNGTIFRTPASKELCITTVNGGGFAGFLWYAQF